MQHNARRWQQPPPEPAYPLFTPPANRSATSQAAAVAIAPYAPCQRERILVALHAAGDHGATNEELAGQLGIRLSSVAARRRELVIAGKARVTDQTRLTETGTAAAVVVATR